MLKTMRRAPKWAWYAGGAAAALVLLRSGGRAGSSGDIDSLARMLIVEHASGVDSERAQIVNVALNRARRAGGVPLITVVGPGTRRAISGIQSGTWNGSANYRRKFNGAHGDHRFGEVKSFVARVARGGFSNPGYTSFVHPSGMPRLPCASNRVAMNTFAGARCMPPWIQGADRVGIGLFV